MKISHLKVNHLCRPLGFAFEKLVLAYMVEESAGKKQKCARIQIAGDEEFKEVIYDTKEREDIDSLGFRVEGIQLEPCRRYYWKVAVTADNGDWAESEVSWFETAKDDVWQGDWIGSSFDKDEHVVLFRDFNIQKKVARARLYISGLGLYEAYLNREKCGDDYFMPGYCDYHTWIPYQAYELELLHGQNRLEVLLGNGWYKGEYGLGREKEIFGNQFTVIAELKIWYEDGEEQIILTNEEWKCRKSKIVSSGIYAGEVYDALRDIKEHKPVTLLNLDKNKLQPRLSPPLKVAERLKPVDLIVTPAGEQVLDFGQNMTGWVSFQSTLASGQKVILQYGEVLQKGNFYRDNLRNAKAEFIYTSDGVQTEVRPHFTYFGFRYVKLTGWNETVDPDMFTACVIHSEMEQTGHIETSDPRVNRLFLNALWGQKSNFFDVPTDCPQRDSRFGWTGDAQMISGTACYNMDVYAFFNKYCFDIFQEQKKTGGFVPHVVPLVNHGWFGASAAWGDAATIIPWNLYQHFGDVTILERQYASMKAWVDYIREEDIRHGDHKLWLGGRHFGDWLAMDGIREGSRFGGTDHDMIASVYYYYSAMILAKTAKILGEAEDETYYHQLAVDIKSAFIAEYFTAAGRLSIDTMTAHVLVLHFDLTPEGGKKRVILRLREILCANGYRLVTGFVGTPYLCPALSENGLNKLAYQLLLEENCPSWLYEVKMGATTIWERWNSILPDGSVNGTGMNSLNHYSYGSIVEWMYKYMLGLRTSEEAPGFRRAIIEPYIDPSVGWVQGTVATMAGTYKISWTLKEHEISIKVTVPFGAEAELVLPGAGISEVLTAGEYEFVREFTCLQEGAYSLESSLTVILENKETLELLEEYVGPVNKIPCLEEVHSLKGLLHIPFVYLDQDQVASLEKRLSTIGNKTDLQRSS